MRNLPIAIPKSTISSLKKIFPGLIGDIIEPPGSSASPRGGREISFQITFNDSSKLHCLEIFDPNSPMKEMYEYYYDWYNSDKILLKKFHAHYHPDGTPQDVAQYDPWHIHRKLNFADQHGDSRNSADPFGMTIQDVLKEIEGYIAIRRYDYRSDDKDKTLK